MSDGDDMLRLPDREMWLMRCGDLEWSSEWDGPRKRQPPVVACIIGDHESKVAVLGAFGVPISHVPEVAADEWRRSG